MAVFGFALVGMVAALAYKSAVIGMVLRDFSLRRLHRSTHLRDIRTLSKFGTLLLWYERLGA
jgi:hypothetical protein